MSKADDLYMYHRENTELREELEKLRKQVKTLKRKVVYRSSQLADIRVSNDQMRKQLKEANNALDKIINFTGSIPLATSEMMLIAIEYKNKWGGKYRLEN